MTSIHSTPSTGFERIQHPYILPLELSDYWAEGATLWEWSWDVDFAAVLKRVIGRWWAGDKADRWNEIAPADIAGFDAVYLTGGRLEDSSLRSVLSGITCPVVFGNEPVFGGERGGFELLKSRGFSGWVADLGKSQLKLSTPHSRAVFPRDWTRLFPAGEVSVPQIPAQRRRLREYLALKIQGSLAELITPPSAMVFALPTRLDDDGTPGTSSYAGMKGDRTLLRDAVELAGLPALPLLVLNDAELAAHSALADVRLAGYGKVLVLTLGFGIGAALIRRGG